MAFPLVSVIVPTYNHAHYLGRALQSVIDQDYLNWELIVVDNHSSDNTDEVIKKFIDSRITYLKIHNNGVIAASRNAGIRASKGDWVAFLDSDDWWNANKLQTCCQCIDEKVDLIYHRMKIIDDRQSIFKRTSVNTWQVKSPVLRDLLLRGNPIVNSSVMIRKKLINQIGGINEQFDMVTAEDYNTWLQIAGVTESFRYIPKHLGNYLQHSQNTSRKDMSIPSRVACEKFMYSLNGRQLKRLESNFRFVSALFKIRAGEDTTLRNNLWFCICHGSFITKLKSIIVLIVSLK